MKIFGFVGMFCAMSLFTFGNGYASEKEAMEVPAVTIKLLDAKVGEIIQDVGKQVGYSIYVEGELKDNIVSGVYTDVSLDQFFHRIFKHENVAVDIDTNEKQVIIHLFNSAFRKEYVRSPAKNNLNSNLALSNVSFSELEEIFAEEEEIYRGWSEDPNAIMPFTSMAKFEVEEIIDQEAGEYQEQKLDPDMKVALSELTQSEATLILEQEGQEEQARVQNPDVKIALSDMTQAEYRKRIEDEGKRIAPGKSDPNAPLPFSNVTYSEFLSQSGR